MRGKMTSLGFAAAMLLAASGVNADPGADEPVDVAATAVLDAAADAAGDSAAGAASAVASPSAASIPATSSRGFDRPGPGTFFAAVVDGTNVANVFRFFSLSRAAGTVKATIYDAATGTLLGTWTSASIPSLGAIEVSAATIAAGATPALTTAQKAAALNIAVTSTFRGTVQQITRAAGAVINQSDCGGTGNILSHVEGPGFTGVTGAVRIVNASNTAGTITLSLRNAATGVELGTWKSAAVPAHGTVTMTATALAAAATPVVPAATTALTIFPTAATARLEIERLASATGSTAVSNLSTACPI